MDQAPRIWLPQPGGLDVSIDNDNNVSVSQQILMTLQSLTPDAGFTKGKGRGAVVDREEQEGP